MSSDATTFPAGGAVVGDERFPPPPLRRDPPARIEPFEAGLIATVGTAALLLMVVGAFALVTIAAGHPGYVSPFGRDLFFGWLAGPLHGLGHSIHLGYHSVRLDETVGIGGAFVCWLIVLACGSRMHARIAIAGVVALHLIFFLSPPLSLTDVFNYVNYGRMGVVHGLNPYTTIPILEPHTDASFLLSNWHHLLSPYGPLFTLFTYALVPLGVATSFWVMKALLLVAALATLRLVWLSAELLGMRPLVPTLFVGANPVVLLWGLGGDHNDFFMVFFLMLAVYLLLRAQATIRARGAAPGHVAMSPPATPTAPRGATIAPRAAAPPSPQITRVMPAAAPAVTHAASDGANVSTNGTGPHAPVQDHAVRDRVVSTLGGPQFWAGFALIAAFSIKASAAVIVPVLLFAIQRRVRFLAGMVVGLAVFGGATLIAFGPHLPDLSTQSSLVTQESIPNLLGIALGQGGETDTLRVILDGVLIVAIAGATLWAWRTRRWLPAAAFAVFALLLTLSWELPWYVYWLLPLAALTRARSLRIAGVVLSAYLILAWMPLLNDFLGTINFHPGSYALAKQHEYTTKKLLH